MVKLKVELELNHAAHRNAGLYGGDRNVRLLTPRKIDRVSGWGAALAYFLIPRHPCPVKLYSEDQPEVAG
jgi:hypothetical protein